MVQREFDYQMDVSGALVGDVAAFERELRSEVSFPRTISYYNVRTFDYSSNRIYEGGRHDGNAYLENSFLLVSGITEQDDDDAPEIIEDLAEKYDFEWGGSVRDYDPEEHYSNEEWEWDPADED